MNRKYLVGMAAVLFFLNAAWAQPISIPKPPGRPGKNPFAPRKELAVCRSSIALPVTGLIQGSGHPYDSIDVSSERIVFAAAIESKTEKDRYSLLGATITKEKGQWCLNLYSAAESLGPPSCLAVDQPVRFWDNQVVLSPDGGIRVETLKSPKTAFSLKTTEITKGDFQTRIQYTAANQKSTWLDWNHTQAQVEQASTDSQAKKLRFDSDFSMKASPSNRHLIKESFCSAAKVAKTGEGQGQGQEKLPAAE